MSWKWGARVFFGFYFLSGSIPAQAQPGIQYLLASDSSASEVYRIYQATGFQRLWTSRSDANELVEAIRNSSEDGLTPDDYEYGLLEGLGSQRLTADPDLTDIALTRNALRLARDLCYGKVNPKALFPEDFGMRRDSVDVIVELLNSLQWHRVAFMLEDLRPCDGRYRELQLVLSRLRRRQSDGADVQDSIDNALVNLERLRWMPNELEPDRIEVNIPEFAMRLFRHDSVAMTTNVIVGRTARKTPVLSSKIRTIVLNPYWTVPPTILNEDILPALARDSSYLSRHNLRLIDRHGAEVSAASIDLMSYRPGQFPFTLRQDPGTSNSLGVIKFDFANRFGVYMHDTNSPSLFNQNNRALSSGCVRVQQPLTLAAELLSGSKWGRDELRKTIDSGTTVFVSLDTPMPIYIVYFSNVGKDVYGMDKLILDQLRLPKREIRN